jgi:DNA gyrase/topoisomerase IV subunit A
VDTTSQRTSDEIKGMLYSIQQDYTTRLEARVTEVVNRIIMEHEQRVKSVDEIRVNMETREKMNTERQQYEREEMNERSHSLEGLLRSDAARKEEAIR